MARALKPSNLKKIPIKLPARLPSRPRLPDPNEPDVFEEMTLLEHMEELRDRIIKSVIAIGVAFVAGIFLAGPLLKRLQIEANAIGGFDVVSPDRPDHALLQDRPLHRDRLWRCRCCSGR